MSERNSNGKALNEKVQVYEDGSWEYWRDIPGFEGAYRVSDWGRVKSVRRMVSNGWVLHVLRGRILARTGSNYPLVHLRKDRKYYPTKVHVAVLTAFVCPRPPGMIARHFPDKDIANCQLENLHWGTRQENEKDKEFHGTTYRGCLIGRVYTKVIRKGKRRCALTDVDVLEIRRLGKIGVLSIKRLSKKFQVSSRTIKSVLNRETWADI